MQAGVAKYDRIGSTSAFAPFNFKQRVLSTRPANDLPWSCLKLRNLFNKLANFLKKIKFNPIILMKKGKIYKLHTLLEDVLEGGGKLPSLEKSLAPVLWEP